MKKAHASDSVALSDPESVAKSEDKFIVKPKFEAETGGKGKGKYEDYHWANLCEDATKLKNAPCARIEQILKTSWTIKTASEEQQE